MISVLKEFKKRQLRNSKIDRTIQTLFLFNEDHKKRLRREATMRLILSNINEPWKAYICKVINQRMEFHGFKPVTVKGYGYYKNVTIRRS